jgi:hypothetical protein
VSAAPLLLAHQGGWDEILLIAGPILVIVGLLWLAKRRVDAAHDPQVPDQPDERRSSDERRSPDYGSPD